MKPSDHSVVPSWAAALEFRTGFTGFIIVFHKIEKKTRGSDRESEQPRAVQPEG